MSWTSEGHRMNGCAASARDIQNVGTRDFAVLAKELFGETDKESVDIIKLRVRRLIKDGWIKELPDMYVMTEKARQRVKMLKERVKHCLT